MAKPEFEGRYQAKILESGVERQEGGHPQFSARLSLTAWLDPQTKQWRACDFSTRCWYPIFVTDRDSGAVVPWESKIRGLQAALGWDGLRVSGLGADFTGKEIEVVLEKNSKGNLFVKWINPIGGSLRRVDAPSLAALDTEYSLDSIHQDGGKDAPF